MIQFHCQPSSLGCFVVLKVNLLPFIFYLSFDFTANGLISALKQMGVRVCVPTLLLITRVGFQLLRYLGNGERIL
jgi:hypothetical protein